MNCSPLDWKLTISDHIVIYSSQTDPDFDEEFWQICECLDHLEAR